MSSQYKQVLFVGQTVYGGKTHDYSLLEKDIDPAENWFLKYGLWVDLGYQGIEKEFGCGDLKIPFKKPRKSKKNPDPKLTPEQKEYNRFVGKNRVVVENCIAGVKRFHILRNKFRYKSLQIYDETIELCAGLWNYKLRNPTTYFS